MVFLKDKDNIIKAPDFLKFVNVLAELNPGTLESQHYTLLDDGENVDMPGESRRAGHTCEILTARKQVQQG